MIFQDPMTSLNPTLTIGTQITETLRRHLGMSSGGSEETRDRAPRGGRSIPDAAAASRTTRTASRAGCDSG